MNPVAEKPINQAPSSEPSQPPKKRTFFKGIGNMLGVQVVKAPIDTTRPEAQAQPTGEFGVQVKPAGEMHSQIDEVAPVATPAESTEIPVTAAEAELKQSGAPAPAAQTAPVENEVVVVPSVATEIPKDEASMAPAGEPVIVPAQEAVTEQPSVATAESAATIVSEVQPPVQPEVSNSSFIAADASHGRNRAGTSLAQMTSEQAIQPEEKLSNDTVEPSPTEPQIPLDTVAQVDQGVKNMETLEADGTIPVAPLTDEDRAVLLANLQELQLPDGSIDKEKFYTMLQEKKDEAMAASLSDPANDSKLEPRIANTVRSLRELGVNTFNKEMVKSIFAKKPQETPVAV